MCSSLEWGTKFANMKNYFILAGNINSCARSLCKYLQKNNPRLITRSFLTIQSVSFTRQHLRLLPRHIYVFSICFSKKKKKKAKKIKLLGLSKNIYPKIKYIFVWKKKAMFRLIKMLFLSFTWFSNLISSRKSFTYYPHMSVF